MLATLLRASLEGALVVSVIWILVRALPRLTPALRTALWWFAAAKFLLALAWIPAIEVPVLPAPDQATTISPSLSIAPRDASGEVGRTSFSADVAPGRLAIDPSLLATGLLIVWSIGVAMSMRRAVGRWRRTRDVVRLAIPADPVIQSMARDVAARLGLRRAPIVRFSSDVQSPLVVGLTRPSVLLPDRFLCLDARQQQMALCHELAHVRRRDLWLGCAPALAERLFFFHPLVRLAAREYAFWREAACDAAVLEALDAAPQEYGRLLLDLGIGHRRAGLAAAGAPWSFSTLKRRIAMLHDPASRSLRSRVVAAAAVSAVLAAFVPLKLVAMPPAAAGEPPIVAPAPSQPTGVPQEVTTKREKSEVTTERQKDSDLNYVFFVDDRTTMSASHGDMERARRVRRPGESLLWVRLAGKEFVIRDPAVLHEVEEIWRRLGEIGAQQGLIGAKQGMLGSRQGEFGAKQGQLGAEQGLLGARQGVLGARQAELAAEASIRRSAEERKAMEAQRAQIEAEMEKLDQEMRLLDARMREFQKPMEDLGRQMEELGKEMEILGGQMEAESRKAEADMRALIERAIQSGAAQVVK